MTPGQISGRMTFLDIQTSKVVACQLHLGTVHNLIAHADEHILDLLQNLVHGMLMAHSDRLAGDGHIDGLACQLCFQHLGADGSLALLQLCFDFRTNRICDLAHHGALFGRQLAHLLQNSSQLAFFTQKADPEFFQRSGSFGSFQCGQSLHPDIFQLLFHIVFLLKGCIKK